MFWWQTKNCTKTRLKATALYKLKDMLGENAEYNRVNEETNQNIRFFPDVEEY